MVSKVRRLWLHWWDTRAVADALVVAALIGWWLTSQSLSEEIFPSPVNVFWTMIEMPFDPEFGENAFVSAIRVWLAVGLALVLGSAIALLPRYFP